MSGLNGRGSTHDPSDRLSFFLFDEVTKARPNQARGSAAMKDICQQCHTSSQIDRVYKEAEAVVEATNEKVLEAKKVMTELYANNLIATNAFKDPVQFKYFDLWHYYGRTAKHGAFMGGADFVQWHGNYPILQHLIEIRAEADKLRHEHAGGR